MRWRNNLYLDGPEKIRYVLNFLEKLFALAALVPVSDSDAKLPTQCCRAEQYMSLSHFLSYL